MWFLLNLQRLSSSGGIVRSSSLSNSGSISKSSLSNSGSFAKSSSFSTYSNSQAAQGTAAFIAASQPPPTSSYSSTSSHYPPTSSAPHVAPTTTTTSQTPYSSGGNFYSDSAIPPYAQPAQPHSTYHNSDSSYSSYSSQPSQPPQPPGLSSAYGQSNYGVPPPSSYPPAPQYSDPNPYNVAPASYPPAPNYPQSTSSYVSYIILNYSYFYLFHLIACRHLPKPHTWNHPQYHPIKTLNCLLWLGEEECLSDLARRLTKPSTNFFSLLSV